MGSIQPSMHDMTTGRAAKLADTCSTSTIFFCRLVAELRKLRGAVRPAPTPGGGPAPTGAPPADAAAATQLALLLRGLGQCVSYLHERKHEALVSTALDLPLWGLPSAARGALLDLITHLVVANGALVQSCLQTLVYGLLPPPAPPQPDARAGQAWQPEPPEAAVQDEVLAAAMRVLALVPTSAGRLLPLLLGNLPHKLRDRGTHCLYLRGLFALAESGPGAAIREGLLAGVLDHLISVDVEIRCGGRTGRGRAGRGGGCSGSEASQGATGCVSWQGCPTDAAARAYHCPAPPTTQLGGHCWECGRGGGARGGGGSAARRRA